MLRLMLPLRQQRRHFPTDLRWGLAIGGDGHIRRLLIVGLTLCHEACDVLYIHMVLEQRTVLIVAHPLKNGLRTSGEEHHGAVLLHIFSVLLPHGNPAAAGDHTGFSLSQGDHYGTLHLTEVALAVLVNNLWDRAYLLLNDIIIHLHLIQTQ